MSQPLARLPIFLAWQIPTLQNSAQIFYLLELLPAVLEHPMCSTNPLYLVLSRQYDLTRYYLLSLSSLD